MDCLLHKCNAQNGNFHFGELYDWASSQDLCKTTALRDRAARRTCITDHSTADVSPEAALPHYCSQRTHNDINKAHTAPAWLTTARNTNAHSPCMLTSAAVNLIVYVQPVIAYTGGLHSHTTNVRRTNRIPVGLFVYQLTSRQNTYRSHVKAFTTRILHFK
jgi:hypothetical protein